MNSVVKLSLDGFFEFCKQLRYGWVDGDGREHGTESFVGYGLSSPERLIENGVGICWDMTELQRMWFEAHEYKFETFLLYYYLNDECCPSHSILAYENEGKWFWFEPMFHGTEVEYCGIHKYDTLEELLSDFKRVFEENGKLSGTLPENTETARWCLYQYDKPKYGISDGEFFDHCRKSRAVKV